MVGTPIQFPAGPISPDTKLGLCGGTQTLNLDCGAEAYSLDPEQRNTSSRQHGFLQTLPHPTHKQWSDLAHSPWGWQPLWEHRSPLACWRHCLHALNRPYQQTLTHPQPQKGNRFMSCHICSSHVSVPDRCFPS